MKDPAVLFYFQDFLIMLISVIFFVDKNWKIIKEAKKLG